MFKLMSFCFSKCTLVLILMSVSPFMYNTVSSHLTIIHNKFLGTPFLRNHIVVTQAECDSPSCEVTFKCQVFVWTYFVPKPPSTFQNYRFHHDRYEITPAMEINTPPYRHRCLIFGSFFSSLPQRTRCP